MEQAPAMAVRLCSSEIIFGTCGCEEDRMSFLKWALIAVAPMIFTVGCASSKIKERKEQRDKIAQVSKLYCEFVNGDVYPDIDVALNLEMAKKCDLEKPFSLTQYKTPSESSGVIYCCNVAPGKMTFSRKSQKANLKTEDKKSDGNIE